MLQSLVYVFLLIDSNSRESPYNNWHSLKDSNLRMSESKSDALDQLGEESITGCGRCIRNTWAELMRLTDRLNARNIFGAEDWV